MSGIPGQIGGPFQTHTSDSLRLTVRIGLPRPDRSWSGKKRDFPQVSGQAYFGRKTALLGIVSGLAKAPWIGPRSALPGRPIDDRVSSNRFWTA
jgi:hypothetical protein